MKRFAAILALVILVGACSNSAGQDDAATTTSAAEAPTTGPVVDESEETLESVLDGVLGIAPGGIAVLNRRDGVTETAAVGMSSANGDPLSPDAVFRVGSIAKPFVATMILQLVDEGAVDLDAPLATYLPEATVGAEVSIRHLLSHRSGIPNYTDQPAFFADVLAERERIFDTDEILGYVADVEAQPADTAFAYSNTNYILLGQLIETLDGTDLNTALRQRITGPVGLDDTWFTTVNDPDPAGLTAAWSTDVLAGEPDAPSASMTSSAWAAGALLSTTEDLVRFLDGLFDGELISEASLDEMTNAGPERYGLGLLVAGFGPSQSGFGHSGGIFGYISTMAIDPDTGDALVVLTNNDALVADLAAAEIIQTLWLG